MSSINIYKCKINAVAFYMFFQLCFFLFYIYLVINVKNFLYNTEIALNINMATYKK